MTLLALYEKSKYPNSRGIMDSSLKLKRIDGRAPPGVEVRDEALGVTPGRTASSADLGGSSKYSNENFED